MVKNSFASVATQFLNRPGYAPTTLKSYELTLLPLMRDLGQLPIEHLVREDLESYLNGLEHLSYNTHRRHQAIIQALLNFAVDCGYIRTNPIHHLKQRKPNLEQGEAYSDDLIRYLMPEQIQLLYRVIKRDVRLNALVQLLHRTGARISEILALDLNDIDFSDLKFQVIGKGNKRRWCFFNDDASDALSQYIRYTRRSHSSALFTAQQPFTKEITRLSYASAYKAWKILTDKEPLLKGSRLHDLRHTFATERVGLMEIEELRALMGHEKIQTTLRYQKVTSARAQLVAQRALNQLTEPSTNIE